MPECAIALGGNMGNPTDSFAAALKMLADRGVVSPEMSPVYSTAPMGADAGDEFTNAVMVGQTELPADELLSILHRVEADLGRERNIHWGPRIIDLDLIYLGQQVIYTAELVVPHPAMWYRNFVLQPLTDLRPAWLHPVLGESTATLAHRVNQRPLRFHLTPELKPQLKTLLASFPEIQFTTDVSDTAFASLFVADSLQERIQPHHEFTRRIQIAGQDLESSIRDIATAVGQALSVQ